LPVPIQSCQQIGEAGSKGLSGPAKMANPVFGFGPGAPMPGTKKE